MSKSSQDLKMFQGDKKTLKFTVIDEDNPTPDTPKDITALDIRWALVKFKTGTEEDWSATPIFDKESTAGATEIDKTAPATGDLEVYLVNVDTIAIKPGKYHHQLTTIEAGGEALVVATGVLTLKRKVVEDSD